MSLSQFLQYGPYMNHVILQGVKIGEYIINVHYCALINEFAEHFLSEAPICVIMSNLAQKSYCRSTGTIHLASMNDRWLLLYCI